MSTLSMSTLSKARPRLTGALLAVVAMIVGLVSSPAAHAQAAGSNHRHSLGITTVTTAPGIATTLLGAHILPLPVPGTRVGLSLRHGIAVSYGFPITGSTANLSTLSGDITHSGGIDFVSFGASLEIGKFDVDLKAGKIFATQVNFASGRIPVLDLKLAHLKVTKSNGRTVLSGITLNLDSAAATALNSTFHVNLPTNGSLVFATATICLNG